ncbi:acyl carrier protein [Streptomyces sp. NPDC002138]|uniref:acyl carrier protein n=1 Tax=Streptomyces sp. NPDC002138 TaxID=3154410 RepID=UPI00331EED82
MASDTPAAPAPAGPTPAAPGSPAHARILAEITGMLVEIVGDEFLLAEEVTMATTLNDDLALESIEFVALAEQLHDRYGTEVDLMGFLAEKDMEAILAMSLGDLVTHIGRVTHRSPADTAPSAPSAPRTVTAG